MPHPVIASKPLRSLDKFIEARCYNRARIALRRVKSPLRLELPRHRGLDALVSDSLWLCVDSFQGDQPVLAWSDFAVAGRDNLHLPIACRLHLYHSCAGLIMGSAIDALDRALAELLGHRVP